MVYMLARTASSFTASDSLKTLLSIEGLVFATFSITLGFTAATAFGQVFKITPRVLVSIVAGLMTLVAVGAVTAWMEVFCGHFPHSAGEAIPVLIILLGAIVQPAFAWLVWWNVDT
jgi:CBS domain containing-hemolysin-like protein